MKLCEKSKNSITFKNKKTRVAFISACVEPCFGCGNLSNFSRKLPLYILMIAILNGIVIAIVRPYLALGTTCVARRPDPIYVA